MKHSINLVDEFGKLGIAHPSEELLDAAEMEAERQFVLKPALIAAFNGVYGGAEKRRGSVRRSNAKPNNNQLENNHA